MVGPGAVGAHPRRAGGGRDGDEDTRSGVDAVQAQLAVLELGTSDAQRIAIAGISATATAGSRAANAAQTWWPPNQLGIPMTLLLVGEQHRPLVLVPSPMAAPPPRLHGRAHARPAQEPQASRIRTGGDGRPQAQLDGFSSRWNDEFQWSCPRGFVGADKTLRPARGPAATRSILGWISSVQARAPARQARAGQLVDAPARRARL